MKLKELEELIRQKGALTVMYYSTGGAMGVPWSATLNHEWPFCSGTTLEQAIDTLVNEHQRLKREELQLRINEIDASSGL